MTAAETGINWKTIGVITPIVVAIVTIAVGISNKIFKFGKLASRLEAVETDIKAVKKDISEAHRDLTKRIDNLMQLLAQKGLSEAHSPRVLSKEGQKVLEDSGINTIVDDKFDFIVKRVQARKPNNPYQAEQTTLEVVAGLATEPALKDAIEEGAFNSGQVVTAVLFVGGLYIRDKVLAALNMKPEEIDKHTPKAKPV